MDVNSAMTSKEVDFVNDPFLKSVPYWTGGDPLCVHHPQGNDQHLDCEEELQNRTSRLNGEGGLALK
jgi:hypothetical protein